MKHIKLVNEYFSNENWSPEEDNFFDSPITTDEISSYLYESLKNDKINIDFDDDDEIIDLIGEKSIQILEGFRSELENISSTTTYLELLRDIENHRRNNL
jgi:hypothetical protein